MVRSARSRPAFFVVAFTAVLVSGCGSSAAPEATAAPSTTTPAPAPTAATTVPAPTAATSSTPPASTTTTTTAAVPSSLKPNDQEASEALISAWAEGNRTAALAVATVSAVDSLFAYPYPAGSAVFRGCTVSFPPLVCTFGAPGGGTPNAAIIEVSVTQTSGGWYNSAVVVET